jgi:DHA2 family multidrug resistance protein-like MFS transporter
LVAAGFVVAAVGLATISLFGSQPEGFVALIAGGVILAIGLAPVIILATDLVVGAAPPERAGSASALSETSAELGGALGIATLGSVITAVYRGKMANLSTTGLSSEFVAGLKDSLASGMAIADGVPVQLVRSVMDNARSAFADGMQVSAGAAAVVALMAAFIAVTLLRQPDRGNIQQINQGE